MSWPTKEDLASLNGLPKETLLRLFFLQVRNIWRVDGLYFLGIEERLGTEEATRIDANSWKVMGRIEARELKQELGLKQSDVAALIQTLRCTSWALYQTAKEAEVSDDSAIFRVSRCRTQETRLKKGLGEFPCRRVRFAYLKSFAEEFNPNIEVECKTCPPGPHPRNMWCEWAFTLRKQ
jgi:hypothetical protein